MVTQKEDGDVARGVEAAKSAGQSLTEILATTTQSDTAVANIQSAAAHIQQMAAKVVSALDVVTGSSDETTRRARKWPPQSTRFSVPSTPRPPRRRRIRHRSRKRRPASRNCRLNRGSRGPQRGNCRAYPRPCGRAWRCLKPGPTGTAQPDYRVRAAETRFEEGWPGAGEDGRADGRSPAMISGTASARPGYELRPAAKECKPSRSSTLAARGRAMLSAAMRLGRLREIDWSRQRCPPPMSEPNPARRYLDRKCRP